MDNLVSAYCGVSAPEEWDRHKLLTEANTFWPTRLTEEDLADVQSTDAMYDRLAGEATAYYEQREKDLTPELMREIERRVMLSLIDQRWREHLYEMDYLREGIGLRAMGQRDPLTEWQREGFDMFSQMIQSVNEDFVRLIMHADVRVEDAPAQVPPPLGGAANPTQNDDILDADHGSSPPEDVTRPARSGASRTGGGRVTPAKQAPAGEGGGPGRASLPKPVAARVTNVSYSSSGTDLDADRGPTPLAVPRKGGRNVPNLPGPTATGDGAASPSAAAESDRVGRNDPCPCGSGRKYKNCWGTSNCQQSGSAPAVDG